MMMPALIKENKRMTIYIHKIFENIFTVQSKKTWIFNFTTIKWPLEQTWIGGFWWQPPQKICLGVILKGLGTQIIKQIFFDPNSGGKEE